MHKRFYKVLRLSTAFQKIEETLCQNLQNDYSSKTFIVLRTSTCEVGKKNIGLVVFAIIVVDKESIWDWILLTGPSLSCTLCATLAKKLLTYLHPNLDFFADFHFILNNYLSKWFGDFVWCECIDNMLIGILLAMGVSQVMSHSSHLSQMNSPSKLLLKFNLRLFKWMSNNLHLKHN